MPVPGEEKKAEAEINRLRKLPENKVCANCLAPGTPMHSAVVIKYKIFVCSTCKSAHQGFSHRCKSTHESIWSLEEVRSLEEQNGGGNRAAQRTWLALAQEGDRPKDGDRLEKYKEFVERAYEQKQWFSEAAGDKGSPEAPKEKKERKEKKEKKGKDKNEHRDVAAACDTGWDAGVFSPAVGSTQSPGGGACEAAPQDWGRFPSGGGTSGAAPAAAGEGRPQRPGAAAAAALWGGDRAAAAAGAEAGPTERGAAIAAALWGSGGLASAPSALAATPAAGLAALPAAPSPPAAGAAAAAALWGRPAESAAPAAAGAAMAAALWGAAPPAAAQPRPGCTPSALGRAGLQRQLQVHETNPWAAELGAIGLELQLQPGSTWARPADGTNPWADDIAMQKDGFAF